MFRWRLLSSTILIVAVLGAVCLHGWPGAVVFAVLMAWFAWVAAGEFLNLARACGASGFPRLTQAFAVFLTLAVGILPAIFAPECGQHERRDILAQGFTSLVLVSFLVFGFRQVFRRGPGSRAILGLFISLAGLIYICWTLSFIPRLYFSTGLDHQGRWLALFLVVVTKAGDIGAYATGMLTSRVLKGGNHKIETVISPKKSWEGFCGGVLFCVAAALIFVLAAPDRHLHFRNLELLTWKTALMWGFFCAVLGYWGDVAESALKRAAAAKNSGSLPGLGGVLDVLDSLTLVAPFFYAWLQIVTAFSV